MDDSAQYRVWKDWTADKFGRCSRADAVYFAAELRSAGAASLSGASVLEIGFGNGSFAAWVRQRGASYAGTELDPELVARATEAGFEVHTADKPVSAVAAGRTFDIVAAFDVLEHLSFAEIEALLGEIRVCLKPGGLFIARFPSGDSPFSGAIQFGDLTHRSIIGSGIVHQLALKNGYQVAQIRGPEFPISGFGLKRAIRRFVVKQSRRTMNRFLRIAYFDNQPRVLDPNMVAVLRRADVSMS